MNEAHSFNLFKEQVALQMSGPAEKETCRILVLGSHRARLDRVFSILYEMQRTPHDDEHQQQDDDDDIAIEFLAAVAAFDSYQDESGNKVRYLLKIDYFPTKTISSEEDDTTLEKAPQSLLPFFDETPRPSDNEDKFCGIASAVVGIGLNGEQDGEMIQKFLKAMSPVRSVPVESMTPNAEFQNMTEEFAAFKLLDANAKAEATRNRAMGPGKVAKFAMNVAQKLISERQSKRLDAKQKAEEAAAQTTTSTTNETQTSTESSALELHFIDPDKKRFSCRKCRTILFGQDDLENPPHVPSRHNFGPRKQGAAGQQQQRPCQSIFLQSMPPWAGEQYNNVGRIDCPKCDTKVGHCHWAGAQCSCGTWVCPAIQVPFSKVDEVLPYRPEVLPAGTVVSPLVAALMQSQQR